MNNYSIKPKLIEPRVKYYLHHKLKRDHDKNVKYFTSLYNIKLFGIFVSILGGFIFYKYKMMPEVIEKKKNKESARQYLIQKMSNSLYPNDSTKSAPINDPYFTNNINNHQTNNGLITNLPRYKNDFELLHENFYVT